MLQPPSLSLGNQKDPVGYLGSVEKNPTINKSINTYVVTFKIAGRNMKKIKQGHVIECLGVLGGGCYVR